MNNVVPMIPHLVIDEHLADRLIALSTTQLKHMWDCGDWDHLCDEIHAEMNRRGEGRYVAV